ncbi:hypothetical protein ACFLZ0_02305 [Patescibacteria group bacterium]
MKLKYFLLIIIFCLFIPVLPINGQNTTSLDAITLTWSTNTYIPAEYSGKALPTFGSKIEVVAIINDPNINQQKALYSWSFFRNNYLQERITEKGKQTFNFDIGNSIYNIYSIELEIQDEQSNIIGQSQSISIKPIKPQIILQSKLTAFDYSNINLKKYHAFPNQTIEFKATPYFFGTQNIDELNYDWRFGQEKATQSINSENPNIFKLKISESINTISKDIQLFVENKNNSMQKTSAKANLLIIGQ